MEFKELLLDRKTVPRFLSDFISDDDIGEMIATATHACNSGNEQLWQFLIIRSDEIKKRIAEAVRVKALQLIDEVVTKKGEEGRRMLPRNFLLRHRLLSR
jgi:nitroreductase